jgi:O-acetyl-ADP-ribose deacetylase (regulator of RNase III)
MALGLEGRLEVWQGDITEDDSQAIANAANSSLAGGGGVDGAIHAAGGRVIQEECARIRSQQYPQGLPVGEAVVTSGGNLRADYVIHTVGSRWGREKGRESELLEAAYRNSLRLADEQGVKSIAMPAISTGIYGFPKIKASMVAAHVCEEWLKSKADWVKIRLYFWTQEDAEIFCRYSGLKLQAE